MSHASCTSFTRVRIAASTTGCCDECRLRGGAACAILVARFGLQSGCMLASGHRAVAALVFDQASGMLALQVLRFALCFKTSGAQVADSGLCAPQDIRVVASLQDLRSLLHQGCFTQVPGVSCSGGASPSGHQFGHLCCDSGSCPQRGVGGPWCAVGFGVLGLSCRPKSSLPGPSVASCPADGCGAPLRATLQARGLSMPRPAERSRIPASSREVLYRWPCWLRP